MKSTSATAPSPHAEPSPRTTSGWLSALEAAVVFTLIILYIWRLQRRAGAFWIVPLAIVIASHVYRHESLAFLGFRVQRPGLAFRAWGPWVLALAVIIVALGATLHTVRPGATPLGALEILAGYFVWGLFQQYVLNGYFLNRIVQSLHGTRAAALAPLIAGAVFATVHVPNRFLMAVTFVAGCLCAIAFLRYRNLWFLAVAHALIGSLLVLVTPLSIAHGFIVGPNMR